MMIREVPRELWLYPDRGMMKWLGFFMSDHTNYMEQEGSRERPVTPLPPMSASDIDQQLQTSWERTKKASLQLMTAKGLTELTGVVIGHQNSVVFLQTDTELVTVNVADIRHVTVIPAKKWWSS